MFHKGERAVQARAGLDVDNWGSAGVDATIPPVAAEFLSQQRMVVLGVASDAGAVWASALAGPAGFATAADDRTVLIRARPVPGDPTAGLFDTERDVGMLAIEPASRRRMRVNGRVHRDGEHLVLRTEQVYANCPKYIQTRTVVEAPPSGAPAVTVGTAPTGGQWRWITAADTFFVASAVAGLGTDVSHRGGNPGFVAVSGERRLTWPDYVGNSMYMTLGNLELDPRCGLLFLDWESGHSLHLTGTARVDWDADRAASVPGAQRLVDFDIERVVQVSGGLPVRWAFGKYSRFNPPAQRSA